ncbi:MAG: RNA polymerase sigma-70 factor [Gemmatimonadaceae bacterium]|nr:RNA polymerase sigma-70 factor [Gemmatimonadaceae bacterium]NUP54291.1 RNA polymerase sigma-70 factor [Gemmatimonadaceae bacterium]NUP71235.1 RNA polymerase sigma-70 factor [Gemmatimonadaceae bacterium]NUR36076.1 RNA polymerase sigma-70 factor [Gemmatimonadaceae bacterium]NUS33822.1 RNA polymerase sigma-70 factor [Gemmatimonadaceae bacterium]
MSDHGADSSAFGQLFETHAEPLRRYARRFVRSREAAEDLVQDVFFRLWRGWETVETGPGVRAYLYVATRSWALNYIRHEDTEARARVRAFPGGVAAEEPALPPEGERKLEADDITRAIEQVLASMPPRQREVATLRLRHQLSTAAIAEMLGISPRTVEVHVARATKALRERLPALLAR